MILLKNNFLFCHQILLKDSYSCRQRTDVHSMETEGQERFVSTERVKASVYIHTDSTHTRTHTHTPQTPLCRSLTRFPLCATGPIATNSRPVCARTPGAGGAPRQAQVWTYSVYMLLMLSAAFDSLTKCWTSQMVYIYCQQQLPMLPAA